jgi:predicted Zn-dependent protease
VLYNDPRVQDYVDRIGQTLVPANSEKLYAFRVVSNPVPSARALSTGTIYISTGLLSLTDNEAQLSYILSHELAHVYKDHWKTRVMVERAVPRYEAHLAKRRAITGAIVGAGVGAALGGAVGQSAAAAGQGLALGVTAGLATSMFMTGIEAKKMNVDWTLPQEDEADAFALRNALDHNYDVNEVPKLYATLKGTEHADSRVSLGFVADGRRIDTRTKYVNDQMATTYKVDYEKKLKAEQLVGTSPDYQLMMAELKRDNGILALQFDMLDMANKNLHQAVQLRSDDALALFYLGKIDKLIARTSEQREEAENTTLRAIKLDQDRHMLPEADLQEALLLMEKTDPGSQTAAVTALKSYILGYQTKQVSEWKYYNALPPNMIILYDYLRLLGDPNWKPQFPELQRVLTADFGSGGTNASLGPVVESAGTSPVPNTAAPAPKANSKPKLSR